MALSIMGQTLELGVLVEGLGLEGVMGLLREGEGGIGGGLVCGGEVVGIEGGEGRGGRERGGKKRVMSNERW